MISWLVLSSPSMGMKHLHTVVQMLINSCGSISTAFTIKGFQESILNPGYLCEEPSAIPQKSYIDSVGLESHHRLTKA